MHFIKVLKKICCRLLVVVAVAVHLVYAMLELFSYLEKVHGSNF